MNLEMCFVALKGSLFALFLYDVVYLYIMMVDKMAAAGQNFRNGSVMMQFAKTMHYVGKFALHWLHYTSDGFTHKQTKRVLRASGFRGL